MLNFQSQSTELLLLCLIVSSFHLLSPQHILNYLASKNRPLTSATLHIDGLHCDLNLSHVHESRWGGLECRCHGYGQWIYLLLK